MRNKFSAESVQVQRAVLVVCKFFDLDSAVSNVVNIIRRCCFRILNTSEFAEGICLSDTYFGTKYSVKLRNFTCASCYYCSDYDLSHFVNTQLKRRPACTGCAVPLNLQRVDKLLVDTFQMELKRKIVADFICVSCKAVRSNNLAQTCKICAGSFKQDEIVRALWEGERSIILREFSNVSIKLNLPWLKNISK